MTNTLHRQGTRDGLSRDYLIFILPAAGINKEGCADKLKRFTEIALRHGPVNAPRWQEGIGYLPTPAARIPYLDDGAEPLAVFDDVQKLARVVHEIKEADLGLSIVISGLLEEVKECCQQAGITRHAVEHSLGYRGCAERLPTQQVREIATMCGHGVVSYNLVRKMIDYVKLGKLTPEQGAQHLAHACTCGAFNPARAAALLEASRTLG